jgi:hypothetical protein
MSRHDDTRNQHARSRGFENDDLGKSIAADYLRRSRHILSSMNGSKVPNFDENGLVEPMENGDVDSPEGSVAARLRQRGFKNPIQYSHGDSKSEPRNIQASPMRRSTEISEKRIIRATKQHEDPPPTRRLPASAFIKGDSSEESNTMNQQPSIRQESGAYMESSRLSLSSFLATSGSGGSWRISTSANAISPRSDQPHSPTSQSAASAGASSAAPLSPRGQHLSSTSRNSGAIPSEDMVPTHCSNAPTVGQSRRAWSGNDLEGGSHTISQLPSVDHEVRQFYSRLRGVADRRVLSFRQRLSSAPAPVAVLSATPSSPVQVERQRQGREVPPHPPQVRRSPPVPPRPPSPSHHISVSRGS